MKPTRVDLPTLRAAWWALRALRDARRGLRGGGLGRFTVLPPPALPARAGRGVRRVLRRRKNSCLERALVEQRWLAAHGERHDLVVGVTNPSSGFRAHAWVDGESQTGPFQELFRVPPP